VQELHANFGQAASGEQGEVAADAGFAGGEGELRRVAKGGVALKATWVS